MPATICLITPGHLSSTPRLLKEADALVEAGYRVHVIAGRHFPPVFEFDDQVTRAARWNCTAVPAAHGPARVAEKLMTVLARRKLARSPRPSPRLAAQALFPPLSRFVAAARRVPAGYLIGHCLGGIAVAGYAAEAQGSRFGADLEDFHDAETHAATGDAIEQKARRDLQAALLPRARHLTAASPLIAEAYREHYGVSADVVLNVFPLAEAPPPPEERRPFTLDNPARVYWFSQTIGPGRGLEGAVRLLARLRVPVELQLRGFSTGNYARQLQEQAAAQGLRHAIRFLPPAPAAEMARLAAQADVGLSVEETTPLNRDLCLTNKIFVHLLAGLPVVLSPTRAQVAIARRLGRAALLLREEIDDSAAALDAWLGDPAQLAAARREAWRLGQERFCWDVEKRVLLQAVRQAQTGAT